MTPVDEPSDCDASCLHMSKEAPKDLSTFPGHEVPSGQVLNIVAAHIEPITRFNLSDLQEVEPEKRIDIDLSLVLTHKLDFETHTENGIGYLPSGISQVNGINAFKIDLANRLAKAQREVPQALQNWADASQGSYRRLMPPNEGFLTDPGKVGYVYNCNSCHGKCHISCWSCLGKGHKNCTQCGSSGKIACFMCSGSKRINCGGCGGRGNWSEQITQQVWNYSTSSYDTSYSTVYKSCMACSYTGKVSCFSCDYNGKINCGTCGASGKVSCNTCVATGKIDCSTCNAQGILHVWGFVNAEVERDETLHQTVGDDHLQQLILNKLPFEKLPSLGELINVSHLVHNNILATSHALRLNARCAQIRSQDKTFVIHGFGPDLQVFSFENIAGHLLTDDLSALEICLSNGSRWRKHHHNHLLKTTGLFLRSELNMLIAEKVTDLSSTAQDSAIHVEARYQSLIDADYVVRVTSALRMAVSRLYGTALMESAAYLCGITAIVASLFFATGWPHSSAWSALLLSSSAAMLFWIVLDLLTRRQLAKHFEKGFGDRVLAQLRATGSVNRWRWGMGIASLLTASLAIWGTSQVPFITKHRSEVNDMAQAALVLTQWPLQQQVDFRLRKYPSRKMLEEKAAGNDPKAQLILAWQLLLGADGASKDVEAAGKWLNLSQSRAEKEPLWQAAHAVWLLNQDSMPDAIKAAAQNLKMAADHGLIEARFWEARIYLEERSPLYDLKRGLHTLTMAADHHHAHAALNLGERMSSGIGLPRNSNSARRYLQHAANAGLSEARMALDKLR